MSINDEVKILRGGLGLLMQGNVEYVRLDWVKEIAREIIAKADKCKSVEMTKDEAFKILCDQRLSFEQRVEKVWEGLPKADLAKGDGWIQVGFVRQTDSGPVFWDMHVENFENPEDWKPVYVEAPK